MNKKIVIACDSFKGSLSSKEAGEAIKEGILSVDNNIEVVVFEIADGGEGMFGALSKAVRAETIRCCVHNPLGHQIDAEYGKTGSTAIIESALACGLTLLSKEQRDPMIASSFGLGEIILDALSKGCKKFIIGLGGSATNDAGAGMLQVLVIAFMIPIII